MRACRELPAQLGENAYRPPPEKTRAPSSAGRWHDHPLLRILAVARLLCSLTAHILDAYAFKHMPIALVSVAALSRTEAPSCCLRYPLLRFASDSYVIHAR